MRCAGHPILAPTTLDTFQIAVVQHLLTLAMFFEFTEDDEFEEFDPAHWNKDAMEEETQQQWMENWDDDIDDDFTKNLREQLQKSVK